MAPYAHSRSAERNDSTMETYRQMKDRHQAEVNAFPLGAAFSEEQLREQLQKLGLDPDTGRQEVVGIGAGCFIRKTDKPAFLEMMDRHAKERKAAIEADTDGTGFIFQMFRHELSNHEYSYTRNAWETLDALGLTLEDVNANPALLAGLESACKACVKEDE